MTQEQNFAQTLLDFFADSKHTVRNLMLKLEEMQTYSIDMQIMFLAPTSADAHTVTASCISISDMTTNTEYSTPALNRALAAFAIRTDMTLVHPDLYLSFSNWHDAPSDYQKRPVIQLSKSLQNYFDAVEQNCDDPIPEPYSEDAPSYLWLSQ
jgi:hypothetical protein